MNHRKTTKIIEKCWLLLLSAGGALGCSVEQGGAELGSREQAVTGREAEILGFEKSTDWKIFSGAGTLGTSSLASAGKASLSVLVPPSGTGYAAVRNVTPITKDAMPAPTVVGYDIWIPSQQVNPNWHGDTQLYVDAPSAGVYQQYLGARSLQNLPKGQFVRVEFPLTDKIRQALDRVSFTDLRFTVAVNVPPGSKTHYLDRLTFGATPRACTPVSDANVCTADTCDPATGATSYVPVAPGTLCTSDGNACNGIEACNGSGACVAGTAPVVDDQNACTVDTCNPLSGVSHTPVAAGSSCADGDVCNGSELCNASGTCLAGTAPDVEDNNPCTADACDAESGVTHTPVAAGTTCADDTVCNGDEVCDAVGACIPGTALATDDENVCTADSCDPDSGVSHEAAPAGSPCGNGSECTGGGLCDECDPTTPSIGCGQAEICTAAGECSCEEGATRLISCGALGGSRIELCSGGTWVPQNECEESPTAFITRWDPTQPGGTASNQIRLPVQLNGRYDFVVDWGDGTSSHSVWPTRLPVPGQPALPPELTHTHTYESPCTNEDGTCTVRIEGLIQGWAFPVSGIHEPEEVDSDAKKLLEILQWGTLEFGGNTIAHFNKARNLVITATDAPLLGPSLQGTFSGCSSLTDIPGAALWDMSAVRTMGSMFADASVFNGDVSSWETGNVTSMSFMFSGAAAFNQDIGDWDTSNVTGMHAMFEGATAFNQDIGDWDTGNVTDLGRMFKDARQFNQDIGDWDTSENTSLSQTFSGAFRFNQDIGDWDTSEVVFLDRTFRDARVFNQDLNDWDTGKVVALSSTFEGAHRFNGAIGNWDISDVTSLGFTFAHAHAFNRSIAGWDVGSVTGLVSTFEDASSFNQDISDWDTSSVKGFNAMFRNASSFNGDIGDWNTAEAVGMESMFEEASSFNQDIGDWDTGNVTSMNRMFYGATAFNRDLGDWNIGQIGFQELHSEPYGMVDMFAEAGLSTSNYNALLIGWAEQEPPFGITFHAGDSEYGSSAAAARAELVSRGWDIEDGGPN